MTIKRTAPGTWPDPYVPGHGSTAYTVKHYDLDLAYRVTPNRLEGTATLAVRTLDDVAELRLDLHRLKVTRVQVDGRPARYTQKPGYVVVRLAAPAPAGTGRTGFPHFGGGGEMGRGKGFGCSAESADGPLEGCCPGGVRYRRWWSRSPSYRQLAWIHPIWVLDQS